MATYTGIVKANEVDYTRADLRDKWLAKHQGEWVKVQYEPVSKNKDPKTAEQLGYYWGLLVGEITDELNSQGNTISVEAYGVKFERPYFTQDTHELLTRLCGRVGHDGAAMRLSEMDLIKTRMFIDNVIDFAVGSLLMDGEKLEAWKPGKRKIQ